MFLIIFHPLRLEVEPSGQKNKFLASRTMLISSNKIAKKSVMSRDPQGHFVFLDSGVDQ